MRSVNHATGTNEGRLLVDQQGDPGPGEFRVERVRDHQRLLGVVGLDYQLRHALEGITPEDAEPDRTHGSRTS